MSFSDIQSGLIEIFLNGFPTPVSENRVAYENVTFDAPAGKPWFALAFMPASEEIATLGSGGFDEAKGLFQVSIYYPKGGGERDMREVVDLLRDLYAPGNYGYGGEGYTILSRQSNNARESNGFHFIPFTIRWRAYLIRN